MDFSIINQSHLIKVCRQKLSSQEENPTQMDIYLWINGSSTLSITIYINKSKDIVNFSERDEEKRTFFICLEYPSISVWNFYKISINFQLFSQLKKSIFLYILCNEKQMIVSPKRPHTNFSHCFSYDFFVFPKICSISMKSFTKF